MTVPEPSPREELIFEVLKAASARISAQDFEIQCQLAPATTGKSYLDRLRALEHLIQEGIIEVVDGRLRVVAKILPDWLRPGLLGGSQLSWAIFEVIDSTGSLRGKIDLELLAAIGLGGEMEVVRQLERKLSQAERSQIQHVSLVDDSLGFDIYSPSTSQPAYFCHLEVKTSSRPGSDFRFFITRNEAVVASNCENWRLIAVRKEFDGYKILGHLRYSHFLEILPMDTSARSRWETAMVNLPVDQIVPGLP